MPAHPARIAFTLASLTAFAAVVPAQQYTYPFQNPNLSLEQRVANILSLLTLDKRSPCSPTPRSHGSGFRPSAVPREFTRRSSVEECAAASR